MPSRRGGRAIFRTYSTARIPPAARLAYWNDIHWRLFTPLEVTPFDRGTFEAEIRFDTLGTVGLARTTSRAATIEHSEQHVNQTTTRQAFLIMPTRGAVALSCYGREAVLEEGDFALSDSLAASSAVLNSTNRSLLLSIPYEVLTTHIPDPRPFFGLRISGSHGFGQTVNTLLRSVWAQAEQGIPSQAGPQVAHSLLALVAMAYAMEHQTDIAESSLTAARRGQIKRFIELHLRDTDLSAVTIAKALTLSPRYVRMVFAAENEHISAYVLRRRLEECAKQLRNRLWLGRSITETAFDWGFCSTAHFTRVFKQQFGVTPSDYRHARSTTRHAAENAEGSRCRAVGDSP